MEESKRTCFRHSVFGMSMKCVHRDVRKAAQYRNLELRELVRVGDKLAGWKRQVVFKAMELGRGSKTNI